MTQPVAPGARAACFEPPDEPIQCTAPQPSLSPLTCSEDLTGAEALAARAPPTLEPHFAREPAGLRFCREADTVAQGFLCGERVVVSDACRKPSNALDAYICDEPRMQALQNGVWQSTLWVVKTLIAQVIARSKGW